MRPISILLMLILIYEDSFSQQGEDVSQDTVIASKAFNKLIKQDIRYAILGDQSATPGIKVEVGKDQTIAITGPISTKKAILTLSAQGSYKNSFLPIIEEGRIVEGTIGFN